VDRTANEDCPLETISLAGYSWNIYRRNTVSQATTQCPFPRSQILMGHRVRNSKRSGEWGLKCGGEAKLLAPATYLSHVAAIVPIDPTCARLQRVIRSGSIVEESKQLLRVKFVKHSPVARRVFVVVPCHTTATGHKGFQSWPNCRRRSLH
jgi:hypothetical protein